MYWFLVARKDLNIALGDSAALKGLNIGAAPWVDLGLRALLKEEGIDPDADVNIAPIPGTVAPGVSFGVTAAAALEDGKIDAFWANGMGAEVAVTKGVGTVVLDPRRGVGPAASFNFTQPVFATTQKMIDEQPDTVAAAVRAIVNVQKAMKEDVSLATEVGRKSLSGSGNRADRAGRRTGSAVLRRRDHARIRDRDERVLPRHGADDRRPRVRGRGGDAVQ